MQIEMLSDYTKSLEEAFRKLLNENQELKKERDFINDYMVHINESGARECELRVVYKKKLSFNTLEFDNIDDLINEVVNEKL